MLARHGGTAWTATGRHTGGTDIELSAEGRDQGRRLGERLAGAHFALVLTSPLRRAEQTCRLAGLGPVAKTCPEAVEWDYGDYEGLTSAQILARAPSWSLWRDGCPGGESPADVGRRADAVLAVAAGAAGDVILFSHGHFLRVLAARWLGLGPEAGRMLALRPAALSVLGREHGAPVIWTWDDVAHLGRGVLD